MDPVFQLPIFTTSPALVTPLKYADVFKAAKTFVAASVNDPLVRYIRNSRNLSHSEKTLQQIQRALYLILCINTKIALTINEGVANVLATPPGHNQGSNQGSFTKIVNRLLQLLREYLHTKINSPEELKRLKEFDNKMKKAVSETFGDYVNEMWYVETLWTDPSSQRHGFGGALIDAITVLADLMSQTAWLQSSNIANTEFYNSHGFLTVETVVVGESNPTWDEQPVVVSIMVRPPQTYSEEGLVKLE